MSRLIKILHIDPDYRINYFILRSRSSIRTSVSLKTAVALLKTEDFDLIISEPHNRAILKKQAPVRGLRQANRPVSAMGRPKKNPD